MRPCLPISELEDCGIQRQLRAEGGERSPQAWGQLACQRLSMVTSIRRRPQSTVAWERRPQMSAWLGQSHLWSVILVDTDSRVCEHLWR